MTTQAIQFTPQLPQQPELSIPQASKPSQTFQEVMKAVQQGKQQSQPSQQPTKPADKAPSTDTAKEATSTQVTESDFVDTTEIVEEGVTQESDSSGLRTMFLNLFGVSVEGIDMNQSDMDILKDLLGKLQDPEQRFAVMLMMAFLQENPDYTLNDLANCMPEEGKMPALSGASPVNTVLNAIMKLMEADSNVKTFPLLDVAKQIGQTSSTETKESQFISQLHEMNAKVVSTPQNAQGQETNQDPKQGLLEQQRFQDAIEQIKQAMKSGSKNEKSKSATDIEQLQQQVNNGVYLRNTAMFTAKPTAIPVMPTMPELVAQVRTGILSNLSAAGNEFVMKLTPEGLGELTVKLAEISGKMTLTLTASNAQTQRLLESQVSTLREVMKPYDVEVTQFVGGKENAAEKFGGGFGQQFSEHQHQAMDQRHSDGGFWYEDEDPTLEEAATTGYTGTETLNTYI